MDGVPGEFSGEGEAEGCHPGKARASSQIPPPWDSGDTNSTGFKQSWMASLSWKELKVISWERNRKRGGIQIGSKKTFYGS